MIKENKTIQHCKTDYKGKKEKKGRIKKIVK